MPDFAIRSKGDKRFVVWLADCSSEHADSVLASLQRRDQPGPRDLELEQVVRLYDLPRRRFRFWR